MENQFVIKKILNNNVIIAISPHNEEVVVIGKGIGFGKKAKDVIGEQSIEKTFILKNRKEKEQYQMLMTHVSEKLVELMNDVILYIQKCVDLPLNEHIHIALTDHISFAIKRMESGMAISNPFLLETRALYPQEYEIALDVVDMIEEKLKVKLPEGEVGFIALHIYSATTHQSLTDVNKHSRLVAEIINLVEDKLGTKLEKESIHYLRFVRHLLFSIERLKKGEETDEPIRLMQLLVEEYPECYSLAWKVMKVMQNRLQIQVSAGEAVYLTLHLQRFVTSKVEKE